MENSADSTNNKSALKYPSDRIAENRTNIRKEAVGEYKEKVEDPLNDWFFKVSLFETSRTFHYLVKMEFEEVHGEDTLIFPNFGNEPKPILEKGKNKYSCLIGFMDKNDSFREYKLVSVKEGRELKISTLHHYAVDTYLEEH